jgi:hypothetical protein
MYNLPSSLKNAVSSEWISGEDSTQSKWQMTYFSCDVVYGKIEHLDSFGSSNMLSLL